MIAPLGHLVVPLPALLLASAALTAFARALLAGRGFERITALVPIDVTDADPLFGALSGIGLVALAVAWGTRTRSVGSIERCWAWQYHRHACFT